MIGWPVGVNQIVLNNTSGALGDGVLSDTMRSGKKKTRLRSTSAPESFSVVMKMTREEFELFRTWYKVDLRMGALSFQFPKIAGTGNTEYKILPAPAWSQLAANYLQVSMQWEEA
jgi:hypothetical protein